MEDNVRERIQEAIVTALTIATALIWKEFIVRVIEQFLPKDRQIFYHFFAALVATEIVVLAMYLYLKTTKKAEEVVQRFNGDGDD